jgi:hypothetical protein
VTARLKRYERIVDKLVGHRGMRVSAQGKRVTLLVMPA